MSKLKKMSIGNNPMVYYDTVVYDYNKYAIFISIIDRQEEIKKMKNELNSKNNIYLVDDRKYIASEGYNNEYISKKQSKSDFAQLIAFKKDKYDEETKKLELYLYKKDTDDIKKILYDKLYKYSSIPLLEEWSDYLYNKLFNAGFLYQLEISTIYDIAPFEPYKLEIQENILLQIVQDGLRKKEITINNCTEVSNLMETVNGLDSYLNIFGETLAGKIQKSFTPKFDPNKDKYDTWVNYYDDSCYNAGIELYDAQKACIQSSVNNLNVNKATFIIAEMGSGSKNVSHETLIAVLG